MLTIIEQFNHWRLPTTKKYMQVVGKQHLSRYDLSNPSAELARWLPNKKAIEIYHEIKRLEGEIVFLQFRDNNNLESQEPLPLEFIIDRVYISIVGVQDIPLPQAFISGRPIDKLFTTDFGVLYSDVPIEINIADLYRLSTINPAIIFVSDAIVDQEV